MVVIPRKKDNKKNNKHIITQIHNYVKKQIWHVFFPIYMYIDELLFGKISVS